MIAFALALLLIVGFYFFYIIDGGGERYRVESRKMVKSVYASGYIDSSDSVIVRPEVSGYVRRIFVREGDTVKRGDLLLSISNDTLVEQIRDLEAQISSIEERLKPDSDFRRDLEYTIEIKREIYKNLEKNYERGKLLFEQELLTLEMFENLRRDYTVAKKEYERQIHFYNDSIKNLRFQLQSLSAKKKALEHELDKYNVRSPIDGTVLRRFVNEGDYVNHLNQTSLLSVGNRDRLEAILFVDEEYLPLVNFGSKVILTVDAYSGRTFEGRVKNVERQVDRSSRTVKVKAEIADKSLLTFGLTVEANIIVKEVEGLFIPLSAYKDGYVDLAKGRRIKKVKVDVSKDIYDGYLLVHGGLKEGDEIIVR